MLFSDSQPLSPQEGANTNLELTSQNNDAATANQNNPTQPNDNAEGASANHLLLLSSRDYYSQFIERYIVQLQQRNYGHQTRLNEMIRQIRSTNRATFKSNTYQSSDSYPSESSPSLSQSPQHTGQLPQQLMPVSKSLEETGFIKKRLTDKLEVIIE